MKKVIVLFFTLVLLVTVRVKADEGMWMLPQIDSLNMEDMVKLGLKLNANDIFDTSKASLTDAIVIFDGGCTGELVSDKGLLFTNHHCGYDQIQSHSTIDHNYLKDGFWANTMEEELPNPGCEVYFLEHIEDVTNRILPLVNDTLNLDSINANINAEITKIEEEASDSGKYKCEVKSLYKGNRYYLFVYLIYKDVRLVGAPPSSIGKFGDDSDNWVWPRHTGDFSIFRIYTAPDGSPAEYSKDNIPLKPERYLEISLDGIKKGDFTFVLGYPGLTDRYLTSCGIKSDMEVINDIRIGTRGKRLEILREAMQTDSLVQIQYAAKYYHSSNGWKYSLGQNKELIKSGLILNRQAEEKKFQEWCDTDSLRMKKYGSVLSNLDILYEQIKPFAYNFRLITEAFFMSAEITDLATDFYYLGLLLNKTETKENEIQSEIAELKERTTVFFKDYNSEVDKNVLIAMVEFCMKKIPSTDQPEFFREITEKYNGDVSRYINKIYTKTIFSSKDKILKFLNKPKASVLSKDLVYNMSNEILLKYFEYYSQYRILNNQIENQSRIYMKARMQKDPGEIKYPDADFTMRLSYGTVEDYYPREAVHYNYFTTLKGVMEKEDSSNYEYIVPKKLKDLYEKSDYGVYEENGTMPVCFITDNDITGGNSGSPVLNNKGELIGIAFDGNWESMSGDYEYNSQLQRSICVDIRYVLFIIDKFAGAERILKELKINRE